MKISDFNLNSKQIENCNIFNNLSEGGYTDSVMDEIDNLYLNLDNINTIKDIKP